MPADGAVRPRRSRLAAAWLLVASLGCNTGNMEPDLGFTIGPTNGSAQYSDLWGKEGERWKPSSRLPDVRFAGYERGALQVAIRATPRGAILIQVGRYAISDSIVIDKPDLVLRGEGRDKTVLGFPRNLTDVKRNLCATTTSRPTSNSWSGGLLVLSGSFDQQALAFVTGTARRGERRFPVSTVAGLDVGPRHPGRQPSSEARRGRRGGRPRVHRPPAALRDPYGIRAGRPQPPVLRH